MSDFFPPREYKVEHNISCDQYILVSLLTPVFVFECNQMSFWVEEKPNGCLYLGLPGWH